ncbi:MAG: RluA family pseudouridine synthase [Bacteroidota bacterium]
MQEDKDNLTDEFYERVEITIDPKQSQIRIDKFLMDRLNNTSRNKVQNALRAGAITVDGKEVKPNFKVKPGQLVEVLIPRPAEASHLVPEDIPLDIRYEDEDLLLVYKPPGMVVHPGIGHRKGTLVNALAHYFGQTGELDVADANYQDRLGLIHRIDKNTSGLLVIGKNDFAVSHLARQFFHHTTERKYIALVWGDVEEDEGTIEMNIGRHERFRKLFTTYPEGDAGKWAVTHYRVLERLYYVTLIECQLETGRTHQIRVHMKHLGHPLFNDERYGGDKIVKGTIFSKYKLFVDRVFGIMPRHALHAKSLGFVHPTKEEKMSFDTDTPDDFTAALEAWRRYVDGRRSAVGDKLT